MSPTSLKLFFYSNRNIVGTGSAIVAASVTAFGLTHDYWPIIIAGAYGAGALLTPADPGMDVSLAREMSDAEIIAGLARIASSSQKALPPAVASNVGVICTLLSQAIPLIAKLPAGNPVAYDIRTTAAEYLPQTLDRYLQMPKAFRATVRDQAGRTPTQMLAEQIDLLKQSLTDMMSNIASADMNKIAANGLFLKDKFATPDFANVIK